MQLFVTTPAPRIKVENAIPALGSFLTCREK
jgi:hypothetical protein